MAALVTDVYCYAIHNLHNLCKFCGKSTAKKTSSRPINESHSMALVCPPSADNLKRICNSCHMQVANDAKVGFGVGKKTGWPEGIDGCCLCWAQIENKRGKARKTDYRWIDDSEGGQAVADGGGNGETVDEAVNILQDPEGGIGAGAEIVDDDPMMYGIVEDVMIEREDVIVDGYVEIHEEEGNEEGYVEIEQEDVDMGHGEEEIAKKFVKKVLEKADGKNLPHYIEEAFARVIKLKMDASADGIISYWTGGRVRF